MALIKAFAYLRTSSAANVGTEKDSDKRQAAAIRRYAKAAGYEVVDQFYDAAVSGADAIEDRPGFMEMMDRIESNGVRTVLVEDASRFARKMLVQELAVLALKKREVRVITASGEDLTETDDESKVMMRQVAGAFAEYEKNRLVRKLRAARDRASDTLGERVEGRPGYAKTNPDLIREARRLARKSPRTGKARSLRSIAAELSTLGFTNGKGKVLAAAQVGRLLGRYEQGE